MQNHYLISNFRIAGIPGITLKMGLYSLSTRMRRMI